jgi:hypothetical protein
MLFGAASKITHGMFPLAAKQRRERGVIHVRVFRQIGHQHYTFLCMATSKFSPSAQHSRFSPIRLDFINQTNCINIPNLRDCLPNVRTSQEPTYDSARRASDLTASIQPHHCKPSAAALTTK